jgi:Cdc6-like AAA superfamily ATPase
MSWIERFRPFRKPRTRATSALDTEAAFVWMPAPTPEAKGLETPTLPRFQSTAGDQLDTREFDRYAVIRSKLRRAYTPAQPVSDPKMFAGRTKVLAALIRAIEDQRLHTIIYGERGIGKTSLLRVLAQAAQEARYLVVYVTCGAGSEFDETMRAVAAKIPLMFHHDYGPTSIEGERGDTLASVLGSEPISVSLAADHLDKIEGTRVLVVLDEYDRSGSEEFRRGIGELLKTLSDQGVRVQFLIAGVAANLTELVQNIPSIQRNVFALQVPRMTAAEIRHIVKNGEGVTELPFQDAAIQAVIARCIGFPYLATMLCHRSALMALEQHHETVGVDDVDAATRETIDEFRGRIPRHCQLQIEQQIRVGSLDALGALAAAAQNAGGWFALEDVATRSGDVKFIDTAKAVVERLASDRVLVEAREDEIGRVYRFLEPSVPPYLWLRAAGGQATSTVPRETAGVLE